MTGEFKGVRRSSEVSWLHGDAQVVDGRCQRRPAFVMASIGCWTYLVNFPVVSKVSACRTTGDTAPTTVAIGKKILAFDTTLVPR